ncbi:MAG: hypothetical protein JHD15_07135 [Phenylobacterium sp.]|uniref:hypothetical protein n=1 Tax=Phenylobacterium sp. TaxID=1871053 RepID=UPI001A274253|nr:hypothetical protein [Phenylobacterium sp.]MBJ7410127.1 hypothetical protein [Phenylobacterium sp.]
MEARIIGPEAELGDVRDGVTFYGQRLTRDWSKVDLSGEALAKAKGNQYVEVREGKAKAAQSTVDPETEETTVKARLDELGVEYGDKDKLPALKSKLDKAEKAQAKAEEEAAAAQEEADRLAAEAGQTPEPQQ